MTALRVMVVDDEPLAREGLAELLAAVEGVSVVGTFGDGAAVIAAVDAEPPDVLFLDIQMPGVNGFDVVAALDRERMPAVVFVTAHDAFAIRAFEVNAVDYLLKPASMERVREALDRARREAPQKERVGALLRSVGEGGGVGRLIVREVGKVIVIPARDVDWIEGADYYARLHVGPKAHLIRETMSSLEERLDPARFMRVHRSTIVNLARVRSIEAHERGDAVAILVNGARLRVTRARREELEARLERLAD